MNSLTIIGNLTREPELRTTQTGKEVCSFTVAVNRPRRNGEDQGADFFRVSAWGELGKLCGKYLDKGRKVSVIGSVSLHTYESNGKSGASMEVLAKEVEFLSPKGEEQEKPMPVQMDDGELPF